MSQELKVVSEKVKPSNFLDYKLYLQAVFDEMKKSIEGYTYKKFGGAIGLSESNVINHIIKGRRPLTIEGAKKVAQALKLKRDEKKYFFLLVKYINEKDLSSRNKTFHQLYENKRELLSSDMQKEKLTYFSKWYFPVIGELVRCKGFSSDTKKIISRLLPNVAKKEIEEALDFLKKVRIIELDKEQEEYKRTELDFSIGHATKDLSISSYHRQMLSQAERALTGVEKNKRNFSAMTLVLSNQKLNELNQLILDFQRKIVELCQAEQDPEEVFQVNIQMFPFTKLR